MIALAEHRRARLAHYGSWPVVLGTLVAALFVSNVFAAPLIAVVAGAAGGGIGTFTELVTKPWVLFLSIVAGDGALFLAVYVLLVRRGVLSWREMGLTGGVGTRSLVRGMGWAAVFVAASGAVSFLLAALGVQQNQAQQFPLQGMGPAGRIGIWIAGVIVAPVTEEIFFRGYVFRAMAERKGTVRGVIYSSALFSLLHLNRAAFLPLAVGGSILAVSYRRTGDLWTPIIAHALNNAFSFSILLAGGS